jgi:NAD(P)-dependent dehydrogenase (short-subunit alcohol dehydrogenase family)
MNLSNAVALVTGSNRGLGRHLTTQLLERGAKVYAGVRNPDAPIVPGAIPIEVDITDPSSVERAAKTAGDVTLLVNSAGTMEHVPVIAGSIEDIRAEMETNYFGMLAMTRAFVPVLAGNGGGTILDVISIMSWYHPSGEGAYVAAKAAAWAAADASREELEPLGIKVTTLHVGYMKTDLAAAIPEDQKIDPEPVATLALDGVAEGLKEVLADDVTKFWKTHI